MDEIKKKLAALSNGKVSDWQEQALWRRKNRDWLKKSQAIAFEVLEALDEKKLTQKKLAELMNVTPQYVNSLVQGRENLTLETIARLEKALGIELMAVLKFERKTASDIQKAASTIKKPKNKPFHKNAA